MVVVEDFLDFTGVVAFTGLAALTGVFAAGLALVPLLLFTGDATSSTAADTLGAALPRLTGCEASGVCVLVAFL